MDMFDFGVEIQPYIPQHRRVFNGSQIIRVFEAFAGIGCQTMALKRLGIPFVSVGISEIDKYALLSYNAIHGETKNYGDITKMDEIPPCDICTWSFPCQDISNAGKQKGMVDGTRSNYGYDFLEVVRKSPVKPRVLIMENVAALLQEKFRKDFGKIYMLTEKMGYKNFVKVMNAKDYGVAQNRERVFMVSILRTAENPEPEYEFEPPRTLTKRLKDYLEPSVDEKYYLSDKMVNYCKGTSNGWQRQFRPLTGEEETSFTITSDEGNAAESTFIKEPIECKQVANIVGKGFNEMTARVYSPDGASPAIQTMGGGNREPKIAEPIISILGNYMPSGKGNANIIDSNGISQDVMENHGTAQAVVEPYLIDPQGRLGKDCKPLDNCPTLRAQIHGNPPQVVEPIIIEDFYKDRSQREYGDFAPTLRSDRTGLMVSEPQLRIRKLTPLECFRLMGISDEDFHKAESVVSNSQLYKMAGNGLVVDVFVSVLRPLF